MKINPKCHFNVKRLEYVYLFYILRIGMGISFIISSLTQRKHVKGKSENQFTFVFV